MKISLTTLAKLAILFFCLIQFSCSDNDDSKKKLEIDLTVLTFQPGAETLSFTITTTEEWNIVGTGLTPTYGANIGTSDWFNISPVYGTGNAQVNITTNADSHNNTMTIQIKYGKKQEKTVILNQN